MGARRQTLAHEQRMPTSQGGTDKYAFSAPYDGHFVADKQSHCRPVVRYSQSEKTAPMSRKEFTSDVSVSNDLCDHVNQAENALTKAIQSLTGVIAKFESLVKGMSCSNDAKSKQIGTDLPHVLFLLLKTKIMLKNALVKTFLKILMLLQMSAMIQLTLLSLFARTKCI